MIFIFKEMQPDRKKLILFKTFLSHLISFFDFKSKTDIKMRGQYQTRKVKKKASILFIHHIWSCYTYVQQEEVSRSKCLLTLLTLQNFKLNLTSVSTSDISTPTFVCQSLVYICTMLNMMIKFFFIKPVFHESFS